MASDKEYLQRILDKLPESEDVFYRPMMGEYIIYYRGKIVGGIYDNRLLVKPTKTAIEYIKKPVYEIPYPGAKEMLLVKRVDDGKFLIGLFCAVYEGQSKSKK